MRLTPPSATWLAAPAAVATIALLSGCGPAAAASPASGVAKCIPAGADGLLIPCPGVADETAPLQIHAAHLGPDGRTLVLEIDVGDPVPTPAHPWGCFYLDSVQVSQSAASVRVTMRQGMRFERLSDGSENGCATAGGSLIGWSHTSVRLDAPLGDRPVVDGSAGGGPVTVQRG